MIERRIAEVCIGVLDPNPAITGLGEPRLRDAGITVTRFDTNLIPVIEELIRDFARQHPLPRGLTRTRAETHDPVQPNEVGPNGFPIGYSDDGDKVEWVEDDDAPGADGGRCCCAAMTERFSTLTTKCGTACGGAGINAGRLALKAETKTLSREARKLFAKARTAARRIETKHGLERLECSDLGWGIVSGRLSALAWVLGSEWTESLDT